MVIMFFVFFNMFFWLDLLSGSLLLLPFKSIVPKLTFWNYAPNFGFLNLFRCAALRFIISILQRIYIQVKIHWKSM